MSEVWSKEQLLQEFAEAYEQIIETAEHGGKRGQDGWGPREVVAHLAGWEIMASVRIPKVVAGMQPAEFDDETQQMVMNDAINSAFVTLVGDQPLATLCDMLRRVYQRNTAMLNTLNGRFFQPGEYVYERTKAVIEHCQEHIEMLGCREV